jgi:hypothetical protein
MMLHLGLAHAADIRMRIADQKLEESGANVEATDISEGSSTNDPGFVSRFSKLITGKR